MPKRDIQYRKLRKNSIGDMRECISLENREIKPPDFSNVGFKQEYTQIVETWAKVETEFNKQIFDGVLIEARGGQLPSHRFTIRYRPDVKTETRIRYKGKLYRIILINNLEERDEYLILYAAIEGADAKEANQ